ncbi:SMI1/KNR4 family protein [Nonomuraea sp. NPDC004354]
MRRLIMSRGVWLALFAAVVAAGIVAIVRSRRRPPVQRAEAAPATPVPAPAPPVTPVPVPAQSSRPRAPWPPAPVLGTPTAEDLHRYAARPSVLDHPAFAEMDDRPRVPLEPAVRRRLTRWGIAGLTLLVLAAGTQALESAVFSKERPEEEARQVASFVSQDALCDKTTSDVDARCLFAAIDERQADERQVVERQVVEGVETQAPAPVPDYQPTPDADCRPGSAGPRVRKVDAKVARAVNRQWRRIEAWLKTNAPKSYRTLGRPGRAEDIAAAEARMGSPFPDDLRASLLRHDGTVEVKDVWGFGFLGNWSLSVEEMHGTWQQLCEIDGEDIRDGGFSDPRTDWWDGRMLPIGSDGSGNHLVIDSVERDVGDTDHEGSMTFTPGGRPIRSYYALLKATADAMEGNGSIGYWKPKAVAGELDWEVL